MRVTRSYVWDTYEWVEQLCMRYIWMSETYVWDTYEWAKQNTEERVTQIGRTSPLDRFYVWDTYEWAKQYTYERFTQIG